jgi:hypothetical protein
MVGRWGCTNHRNLLSQNTAIVQHRYVLHTGDQGAFFLVFLYKTENGGTSLSNYERFIVDAKHQKSGIIQYTWMLSIQGRDFHGKDTGPHVTKRRFTCPLNSYVTDIKTKRRENKVSI